MSKFLFWFTNFVLCSNILKYPMFLLVFWVIATEHPHWPAWFFSTALFPMLLIFGFPVLVWVLYLVFKIRIFIFWYKHSKEGSYARNFFEKFRDDKDFEESVVTRAMFADTVLLFGEALIFNHIVNQRTGEEFFGYLLAWIFLFLLLGTGVFLSYESLSRWFAKPNKD